MQEPYGLRCGLESRLTAKFARFAEVLAFRSPGGSAVLKQSGKSTQLQTVCGWRVSHTGLWLIVLEVSGRNINRLLCGCAKDFYQPVLSVPGEVALQYARN